MHLSALDTYFRKILPIEDFATIDASLNGIQVGRGDLEVRKAAFAVDACLETFERSVETGAQLLFVHHGIFWGRVEPITGATYERIKTLVANDVALYAVHLPLDMHAELGNNAQMAQALGLTACEPFGAYRGATIGFKGVLPEPLQIGAIAQRLFGQEDNLLGVLPFGPKEIRSIGIISGGAPHDVSQAIDQGLDLYITGDANHTIYHTCLEAGINVIFGGHYRTETWGVRAVAQKLSADTGLETVFLDVPSGL